MRGKSQACESLIGLGLERVSGKDRNGFPENDVAGGLAAAEIVVIERRQIVVDQLVGMEHLERRGKVFDAGGRPRRSGDHGRGLDAQHGTKTFASSEDAVPHGLVDRGG